MMRQPAHKSSLTSGDRNDSMTGDQRFTPGLLQAAIDLRAAQRAYMAVRDIGTREEREPLGQAVAAAAERMDAEIAKARGEP